MSKLRTLSCALAVLLLATPAWAQDAKPQVDKDALRAQAKEISKAMDSIRAKLKGDAQVQELLAQRIELHKKLEAKYAELDPKFAELLEQRRQVYKKLGWGKGKKGKGRGKKGKGGKKEAPE